VNSLRTVMSNNENRRRFPQWTK